MNHDHFVCQQIHALKKIKMSLIKIMYLKNKTEKLNFMMRIFNLNMFSDKNNDALP